MQLNSCSANFGIPSIIQSYTGCLKIREFRIQSVVGDHFSSPNMEIKKKSGLPPQRYIGLFEVRFLQIQAEK
jgi:hypothetical protein